MEKPFKPRHKFGKTEFNAENKKVKTKGCACYGVNSIHPCFCSPFSNKKIKTR